MKIALTILLSGLLLFLTMFLAGGGHGTYIPAVIIYPFTMLLAGLFDEIGTLGIALAILQIPIYSLILHKKPNWKYYVLLIHIIALIAALRLTEGSF